MRSETPTVKPVLTLERIRSKPEGKERTIGASRKAELYPATIAGDTEKI